MLWGAGKPSSFKEVKQATLRRDTLSHATKRTLGTGNMYVVVLLPEGEDRSKWLAANTVDFFNEARDLYAIVFQNAVTKFTGPGDGFPAGFEYRWTSPGKPAMRVSGPEYVARVFTWLEETIEDSTRFPQIENDFVPAKFESTVREMINRIFRVFAIIYHASVDDMEKADSQAHLNTAFKRFIFFCFEFKLLDEKELVVLKGPVNTLRKEFHAYRHASMKNTGTLHLSTKSGNNKIATVFHVEMPTLEEDGKVHTVEQTAFFLSHYKVEAGAEALLLLKELSAALVVEESKGFLDADKLRNLAILEEHVIATSILLLLQTENVLFRPWVLVELFTALENDIPILCIHIEGKGYDFDAANQALNNPAFMRKRIGEDEVKELEKVVGDFDLFCLRLGDALPKIIAKPFSTSVGPEARAGMLRDIAEAMRVESRARSSLVRLNRLTIGAKKHTETAIHVSSRIKLKSHTDSVTALDFSADSKHLVTGSRDATIRVWQVNGRSNPTVLEGHTDAIRSVSVNRAAGAFLLASGGVDGAVKIWNSNGIEKTHALKAFVSCVRFDPHGQLLAVAAEDGYVLIYSKPSWNLLMKWQAHEKSAKTLCFSPDSSHLVTGGSDSLVKIWKTKNGSLLRTLHGHSDYITSLAFASNGSVFASASADKTIKLWNAERFSLIVTKKGHSETVTDVCFHMNSTMLFSSSKDKTIRMWNVNEQEESGAIVDTLDRIVHCVSMAPNDDMIAAGAADDDAHLIYF